MASGKNKVTAIYGQLSAGQRSNSLLVILTSLNRSETGFSFSGGIHSKEKQRFVLAPHSQSDPQLCGQDSTV